MDNSSKNPQVSVIIRTKNVEKHFFRLLWELVHQTLKPSEIIVVNNFSSEKELKKMNDVVSDFRERCLNNQIPIIMIPISDNEFSHPFSTNIGVNSAKNELVCITNGHSLPISFSWLSHGIKHFSDPDIAGVSGYFIPYDDGSIWEKIAYGLVWVKYNEIKKNHRNDKYFSTINCVIRKSLWKKYPFDENFPEIFPEAKIYGGEDYDWAREMTARGYSIVVDPKFNVYHSHNYKLPKIIASNLIWYLLQRKIESFKRPRKSYSRL